MKNKALFLVVFICAIVTLCRAQDTVQYMDPCYLFNEKHPFTVFPWPPRFDGDSTAHYFDPIGFGGWDGFCSKSYPRFEFYSCGYPRSSQQEPVTVYGVALTIQGNNEHVLTDADMNKYPYKVIIGHIENNKVVAIDSTTWDSMKDAIASFKYSIMGDGVLYEHVVPVYEFYFDTPHQMSDTFYVGFQLTVNDTDMLDSRFRLICAVDSVSQLWVYNDSVQRGQGYYDFHWGGEFPILQPNRRCTAPEGAPQLLVYTATNTVRFTLPYSPSDSLVLAICEYGQPVDSATIYPVTESTMDIVIPDSGRYTARIARICQRDTLVQSNWSAPTDFFIVNNLSIAQNSIPTLEVYPNPTDGTVFIPAKGVHEVWLVAADGRRSRLMLKDGQVSLKGFPLGLYVLEIQTDEGLFTAKVVRR